jgi:hypothetical protein
MIKLTKKFPAQRPLLQTAAPTALLTLLALCIAPAMFPPADARVPIGDLAGVVLNVHGEPVANAAVTIQTSDGLQPFATRTDSAGHFHFTRLETGQYDLRAALGKQTSEWTKRIMVHSNKTTEITLRLSAEKA